MNIKAIIQMRQDAFTNVIDNHSNMKTCSSKHNIYLIYYSFLSAFLDLCAQALDLIKPFSFKKLNAKH
jgi:hypothetical protein